MTAQLYTFKRSAISLIWSLILAVGGSVAIFFLSLIFFDEITVINFVIAGAILLVMGYMSIFSENISFELSGSSFKYFKRGKLKKELDLKKYTAGYKTRHSEGTADDLSLYLSPVDGKGEEIVIDCTPIGTNKFHKMYELMRANSAETPPEKMKTVTKKKGKEK